MLKATFQGKSLKSLHALISLIFLDSSNEQLTRNITCRMNPSDNGIAANGEFPHVVLVIGKIFDNNLRSNKFVYDTQCAGILVGKLHVITSTTCVNVSRHTHASIKFGISVYNRNYGSQAAVVLREKIVSHKQMTIIELPSEIKTNGLISPTNLPAQSFENLLGEKLILTGWTGYKYECNQQMRKWIIQRDKFKSCEEKNLICLNETDIINYREVRMNV